MTLGVSDLLYAYTNGIFPMADEGGVLHWYAPDPRAVIPFENYRPSRSLRPVINQKRFDVVINHDFTEVMRNCARPRFDGDATWISEEIIQAYTGLHELGLAHSVEAYQKGKLAGGLYGVAIGGAFFGESMFHTVSNASRIAFHCLMEILQSNGFSLLDTQFINDNVARLGAIEIPRKAYEEKLKEALKQKCDFKL